MKTNVEIMSRKAMNILIESGFPKNTAVISFYDPKDGRGGARLKEYNPINYNGICDCVFTVGNRKSKNKNTGIILISRLLGAY